MTLRSGSIPYWFEFNAKPSVDVLNNYLQANNSFDNIYLMPFSNGIEGQGLATVEDYKAMLADAKKDGAFIGSEPEKYPFDFGIYARYEKDLQRRLAQRYGVKTGITIEDLLQFHEKTKGRFPVCLTSNKQTITE